MDISKDYSHVLPQAFADMVRVASNMLIDSLIRGKIVDTITICGLLVSYNKEYTVTLKYFDGNIYKIQVGERDFFDKIFYCTVMYLIGFLW